MIIKVTSWIYVAVADEDQAVKAQEELEAGLEGTLNQYPFLEGEIVDVEVDPFGEIISNREITERGLDEL